METKIYTREEYMQDSHADGMQAHRKYIGQFVNARTKAAVIQVIGLDRIIKSEHVHFSDIPLKEWDRLVPNLPGSAGFAKAGDYYTLSNGVCLAKEAARQIREQHNQVAQ
jgi:hypothetical protein